MNTKDKEQLKIEIDHIFESGANKIRIQEMVENFINKRYVAIDYAHSCEKLKYKTDFEEWKIDNGYIKDKKYGYYFKHDNVYDEKQLSQKYKEELRNL